jgi:hypothetical protein
MVVGLFINVVAPAQATSGSKLPVVVVCTLGLYSVTSADNGPLGSGYTEVRRTQCLRPVAVTNIIYCSAGGFEDGSSAKYVKKDILFLS